MIANEDLLHPVVIGGDLGADAFIKIGDDFRGQSSEITITNATGLEGHVIIHANGNGGTWNADVTVGSATLGDEYTETAASVGGGVVGKVPFATHHESCDPVHGSTFTGTPSSATIQFYGPVKQDETSGNPIPVEVWRGPTSTTYNTTDFTDITANFTVSMHPSGDLKRVKIEPDGGNFRPEFRYYLIPILSSPDTGETILLCDKLLTSSDVTVKDMGTSGYYWFETEVALGLLDMGGNGWVDSPDLAAWDNDPQDFNGDGSADAKDRQLITDNLGKPVN